MYAPAEARSATAFCQLRSKQGMEGRENTRMANTQERIEGRRQGMEAGESNELNELKDGTEEEEGKRISKNQPLTPHAIASDL